MRGGSFPPKADTRKLSLARASAGPPGPAGAVDEPTRFGAGVLAVFQHLHAVDEHVVDSGRELLGLFERGVVLDGRRIEHDRSEEHTSELQSQFHLVCRLLLEKKKKIQS